MPIVRNPPLIQKSSTAPRTVVQGYQQGGLRGAHRAVTEALDPGIGPLAAMPVVGRASASALGAEEMTLSSLAAAKTGEPLAVRAWRWFRGPEVPGTGQFASAAPSRFYAIGKQGVHQEVQFSSKNPLVIDGSHTETLEHFIKTGTAAEQKKAQAALNSALKTTNIDHGYATMDRAIRRLAKGRGHDGLVYRHSTPWLSEVVDIR